MHDSAVVELYSADRLDRLERRCRRVRICLWILAAAALVVCIWLTAHANTCNLYAMMLRCICISVGAAWVIIYLGIYVVRDGGREIAHARHLMDEPRETVTGKVTVLKQKVQIRNSVTLRKVRVETDGRTRELSILLDKAPRLRQAGEHLRLYTAHGYIVAYEVAENEIS